MIYYYTLDDGDNIHSIKFRVRTQPDVKKLFAAIFEKHPGAKVFTIVRMTLDVERLIKEDLELINGTSDDDREPVGLLNKDGTFGGIKQ